MATTDMTTEATTSTQIQVDREDPCPCFFFPSCPTHPVIHKVKQEEREREREREKKKDEI
jgi:hypothetical protein